MKLQDFIDFRLLQNIQDQFSDATGLAAIAVDDQGNYITQGSNFTDFCMKYTRGCPEGLKRCVKCDNECTGTYFCHAGLMDFSADIVVNGEKLGAIIGGQVLPGQPDQDKFRRIARELGIGESEYLAALSKVPVKSEKSIRAAAAMLGDVVNRMVNLEYMKSLNQKKVEVYDKEIQTVSQGSEMVASHMRDLKRVASMENILAINASIEAARAGRAGVGFAVVAREIGELSQQSAEVYEEIEKQILSIKTAVDHMNSIQL